jgi:hypothetical protein
MPANIVKKASYGSVSPLRFAAPVGTPRKNVVLDATDDGAFASPTDGSRFFAPAGTILVNSTRDGKVTAYGGDNSAGDSAAEIVGVLIENVDLAGNVTEGDEPFGAFYRLVSFDVSKLKIAGGVEVSENSPAVTRAATALPTCEFLAHDPSGSPLS